jgi:hypothetical protein
MNPRRLLVFHVLLLLFFAHTAYIYIENEIVVEYRKWDEQVYNTRIQNPLQIIFIGSTTTGENSYTEYPVDDRALRLIQLIEFGLIVAAILRYFISRGQKTGTLLFSLMFTFWLSVAALAYRLIYGVWLQVHPDWPIVAGGFQWNLLYAVLPRFIALIFLISTLKRMIAAETTNTGQDLAPLTWMRGFHVLGDRLIIVFFASNMFVWFSYSALTDRWFPDYVPVFDLRNWAMLSLQVAFLAAYLLTEGLFQLSPLKVLTGTQVVRNSTGQSPSWRRIIGRSLSRLIPLNEFSFIFGRGWHDKLSDTTLQYVSAEPWLSRTSRLVRSFFIFFLCIALWTFVSNLLLVRSWDFQAAQAAGMPQVLLISILPVGAALFICYIASLYNLSENIHAGTATHNSTYFISALLCCLPIFNYILPGNILYQASYNITRHDPDLAERYNRYTRIFCRLYGLAYTLFMLGLWSLLVGHSRVESIVTEGLISLGAIVWCIAIIVYAGQFKSITINTLSPQAPQVTEI